MKSRAHPMLRFWMPKIGMLGLGCFLLLVMGASRVAAQTFADIPEDVSVRFVFKSSGNMNMVGTTDIPVIISVVLSNKSEEERSVFVARFVSMDDNKPKDFPLGCSIRITDAKGTQFQLNKDLPEGFFTSLIAEGVTEEGLKKDGRNRFTIPPKERRGFNIPVAAVLAGGGADATWPIQDGKFIPGAYRLKVKWGGKESAEFSLTVTAQ